MLRAPPRSAAAGATAGRTRRSDSSTPPPPPLRRRNLQDPCLPSRRRQEVPPHPRPPLPRRPRHLAPLPRRPCASRRPSSSAAPSAPPSSRSAASPRMPQHPARSRSPASLSYSPPRPRPLRRRAPRPPCWLNGAREPVARPRLDCRSLRVRSGTLRSLTVFVYLTRQHLPDPEKAGELEHLVVEDAPLLERLLAHDINWGPSDTCRPSVETADARLSGVGIPELQLSSTLFRLAAQFWSVKTLALEMVDPQVKPVADFLRCFPAWSHSMSRRIWLFLGV